MCQPGLPYFSHQVLNIKTERRLDFVETALTAPWPVAVIVAGLGPGKGEAVLEAIEITGDGNKTVQISPPFAVVAASRPYAAPHVWKLDLAPCRFDNLNVKGPWGLPAKPLMRPLQKDKTSSRTVSLTKVQNTLEHKT
jgi:hypothetical protein